MRQSKHLRRATALSSMCLIVQVPLAVTRLTNLQSLYLSRNELEGSTLPRLAHLPALRLLSLIECFPRCPCCPCCPSFLPSWVLPRTQAVVGMCTFA